MLKIALAGALVAFTATPALAGDRANNPQQVSDALAAGCSVQQISHGKIGTGTAIVRCPTEVAKRDAGKANRGH